MSLEQLLGPMVGQNVIAFAGRFPWRLDIFIGPNRRYDASEASVMKVLQIAGDHIVLRDEHQTWILHASQVYFAALNDQWKSHGKPDAAGRGKANPTSRLPP